MKTANKKVWVLGAVVIGLATIGTWGQLSLGQEAHAQVPLVERYRLTPISGENGNSAYIVLLDTQTGRCWAKYSTSSQWAEITPPGLPTK